MFLVCDSRARQTTARESYPFSASFNPTRYLIIDFTLSNNNKNMEKIKVSKSNKQNISINKMRLFKESLSDGIFFSIFILFIPTTSHLTFFNNISEQLANVEIMAKLK